MAKRRDRIEFSGPTCREPGSEQRDTGENEYNCRRRNGVEVCRPKYIESYKFFERNTPQEANEETNRCDSYGRLKHPSQDVGARGAEGHPHTDFVHALRYVIRNHAIDSDCSEREAQARESTEERHVEPWLLGLMAQHLVDRHWPSQRQALVHLVKLLPHCIQDRRRLAKCSH